MEPYGWREGQEWKTMNTWEDMVDVSKEVMSKFLEKYKDYQQHERVIPTDLGYTCIQRIFGFIDNDDDRFRISRRGPNDYNIHQTHNGQTRLFTLYLSDDSGFFKPAFFWT